MAALRETFPLKQMRHPLRRVRAEPRIGAGAHGLHAIDHTDPLLLSTFLSKTFVYNMPVFD
jgi:hypothetical protein